MRKGVGGKGRREERKRHAELPGNIMTEQGHTERVGKVEREGKRDCDEQVHVVKERRCLEERMADRQKEIEKEA